MRGLATALVGVLALSPLVWGDEVVTTSGKTLSGRIVAEDASTITVDTGSRGVSVRETVKRDDVKSITRDATPTGPVYFEIPVMGTIGEQVTAAGVADAFAAARQAHATHVILLFDSPGGLVAEVGPIVDVISRNKDLETIAFVKNAHSAAAVISAACRTIVMHPNGTSGAAVPFKMGDPRMPWQVSEKLTSVFRAIGRSAAAVGNHNPSILMGMIDPSVSLVLGHGSKGNTVREGEPAKGEKWVKPAGKVLTMTANEAVEYGWARGICTTVADVRTLMQVPEWSDGGHGGWEVMQAHAATGLLANQAKVAQKQQYGQAIRKMLEDAKVTPRQLHDDLARCDSEIAACKQELGKLNADYDQDRARLGSSMAGQQLAQRYEQLKKDVETRLDYWQQRQREAKRLLNLAENSDI